MIVDRRDGGLVWQVGCRLGGELCSLNKLVSQRTGIVNQIRAFLLERGIAVRQGQHSLRVGLPGILATPPDTLSPRVVRIIKDLAGDWWRLDECIEELSAEIKSLADEDSSCERLMTVPGIARSSPARW